MSKYGGVSVNEVSAGSKYGGVPVEKEPEYNRLSLAIPEPPKEPTVDYTPESWKARKKSVEERKQIMKILQDQYGDSSTIKRSEYKRKLGPMKGTYKGAVEYDEDELLKRYSKAKWGADVPSSWNPLVHLGHTLSGMATGLEQINPFSSKEDKEKAWQEYQNKEMIYQAGDQPLAAQIAGDALLGLPASLINTPVKAATGQVIKNNISRRIGENILRDAAFTGAQTPPKLLPGYIGATEGAIYGTLQPVDPSLSFDDQLSQRGKAAASGAVLGVVGEYGGRKLGEQIQKGVTRSLKRDIQGSLPKPVELPTPLLYGEVPSFEVLKKAATGSDNSLLSGTSIISQQSAARQLYSFKRSLQDNFDEMNRKMSGVVNTASGKPNMKVGEAIRPVLRQYKTLHNNSWKEVGKAYDDALKSPNQITGDYEGYVDFVKLLKEELDDLGYPLQKSSLTAINQFNKVRPYPVIDILDPRTFNGKSLISRYKALNNLYTNAKPGDRAAINHMRNRLIEYMDTGYFTGDRTILDKFKSATAMAKSHYAKYRGDKTVDKYLDGAITESDVASRVFKGKSLDQNEGPKADVLNKVLNVLPNSKRLWRNEVFASLSDELSSPRNTKQAIDAIPNIRRQILSGSEDGVYGKLFDANQLKQFEDLVTALDIGEFTIDIGRTSKEAKKLRPMLLSRNPTGMISPKAREYALVRRSEAGKIAPSGDLGFGVSTPFALGGASYDQEDRSREALLNRLYIPGYSK